MQVKTLVSLAGGLGEADDNIPIVSNGISLTSQYLINLDIRNDELIGRAGFLSYTNGILVSRGLLKIELGSVSFESSLAVNSFDLQVELDSISFVTDYIVAGSIDLAIELNSLAFPVVLEVNSLDLGIDLASVTFGNLGSFVYWKLLAGL